MTEELTYQDYQKRQLNEVSYGGLLHRAQSLKPGNKFRQIGSGWEPLKYEGYAILSMVNDHPQNSILAARLAEIQIELAKGSNTQEDLYFLPQESFHQTIANLLSEERFKENVLNRGNDSGFPGIISGAFEYIGDKHYTNNIDMHIAGLGIFGSAIGALGVFNDPLNFGRILDFRQGIYTNEVLNQHGIHRTRPFIGHITLAYVESNLSNKSKENLIETCYRINQSIATEDLNFYIKETSLRSYQDLSHFNLSPDYPTIKI